MDNKNRINEITKRLSEISLCISRVPLNTKKDFIGLSNAEFCGDYGLTLKYVLEQANEYQYIKALFFDKLQNMENQIDNLVNSLENKQEQNKPIVKRLGRRELKGGNENE